VNVPVVLHGGAGNVQHIVAAARAGADGVSIASLLHYNRQTIPALKAALAQEGVEVRL
jgi:cyclase